MLLGVTHLHREPTMPLRVQADDPPPQVMETPWFSKLKAHRVTPNPTTKSLKEQCQYKAPKKKRQAATAAPVHTHQQKAQALLAKPLTQATKVEVIKVLTNMPSTSAALEVQLERHLGHTSEDLPLHREVGHALSQTLEERRSLANTLLQNRHYAGGMHQNMLRLMQHRIHGDTTYKQHVKRLYLTTMHGPVPRQMPRWKTKGLQMLHQLKSWLGEHTGTTEHFFKSTARYTTQAYTARWWDDWHRYIKHTLKWWWEHKRDWYESQVEQMNIPMNIPRGRNTADLTTGEHSGPSNAHIHEVHAGHNPAKDASHSLFHIADLFAFTVFPFPMPRWRGSF